MIINVYQSFKYPIPEEIKNTNIKYLSSSDIKINYIFYDNNMIDDYMKKQTLEIQETYNRLKCWPHKIDLWRYLIVYETGGFYIDADVYLHMPINKSVYEKEYMFSYDYKHNNIFNGFFYSKPKNPIFLKMIEFMVNYKGETIGKHFYHYNIDYLATILQDEINIEFINITNCELINNNNKPIWIYYKRKDNDFFNENKEKFYCIRHSDYKVNKGYSKK